MDRLVKPNLEAIWADAILATPIKPQQFPYNAVPTGRSRNTELMSRSLAPQYEGLSFGLSKSQIFTSGIEMKLNQQNPSDKRDLNDLTKSIALFNLNSGYVNKLNGIKEEETHSTASKSNQFMNSNENIFEENQENELEGDKLNSKNPMLDSTLFQEYQKNKAQLMQQLEEHDKKREEYLNQLRSPNVHNALNAVQMAKLATKSTDLNSTIANSNDQDENYPVSPKFNRFFRSLNNGIR
jgi:hypothetical protein